MEMGQILRLREAQNLYGLCLVLICFNHPFLEVPTFDPYIIIAHTEMSKEAPWAHEPPRWTLSGCSITCVSWLDEHSG